MAGGAAAAERCLALWFPAWPVTAWALATGGDAERPVAVVAANRVTACSAAAAAEGVGVGQRRREAQSRCPQLVVLPVDEAVDAREFDPVVAAIERLSPGAQVIRPGLCVVRARGLARYLGDEALAAETILEAVVTETGVDSGRAGVADGVFAAVQAARAAAGVTVVPPGGAPDFLSPLPIARLGDPVIADLLPRLGVHTLGGFAALTAAQVRDRFGTAGVRLHLLASGADPRAVQPREPPPELAVRIDFEPPLTLVDQVAFASRTSVAAFIDGLAAAGLACTEVRVEFSGENDEFFARTWLTPGVFDSAAITDRIRWQLQAAAGVQLHSPVTSVRLEPVAVDAAVHHVPGLFGLGPDERVHHAMSRVQAMLGHEGVLTGQVGGGRWLAERQVLVPWGDRPSVSQPDDRPWPGQVPHPLPATVFPEPLPVRVQGAGGGEVAVDERGRLSAEPQALTVGGRPVPVTAWAGPWPVNERAWDGQRQRQANRFQVVDESGAAWLLWRDARGWWAEARYD